MILGGPFHAPPLVPVGPLWLASCAVSGGLSGVRR